MAAVAAPGAPARGRLSRAGWNVVSGSSLPSLPSTPTDWRAEGRRIIREVVSTWSRKYISTIRDGEDSDGMHHYECLFSLPTTERPVPSIVVAVLFAFVRPVLGNNPRLYYSFEESDLRHEWNIVSDGKGAWQPQKGQQQKLSLKGASFEGFLDFYIREKDQVRSRGIDVSTAFERSRQTPPPACYQDCNGSMYESGEYQASSRNLSKVSKVTSQGMARQISHTSSAACVTEEVVDPVEAERAEMVGAMQDALRAANMYCELVAPPSSLTELLSCIFDAADEDGVGAMAHYEIARLMKATLPGFGLQEWDINQLLAYAREDDEGFINFAEFTETAPERIMTYRRRRANFVKHVKQGAEITPESIHHCYGDELRITADELVKAFEFKAAEDRTRGHYVAAGYHGLDGGEEFYEGVEGNDKSLTLVALKRKYCRDALATLTERISPQEGSMLLQMLPEDESGFLNFEGLDAAFEQLRTEALLNSVVSNDLRSLRIHLVECSRAAGLTWSGKLKLWKVKDILLGAGQLCLSRLQIHMLLCLSDPNKHGDVCIADFLHICAAIIPHLSNSYVFQQTADRLMLEHAEAAKERANAELAALGAAKVPKQEAEAEDLDKAPEKQVDRETVERTLLQSFALLDETRKQPTPTLPPEAIFNCVFNGADQQVQGLCLDELEVAGLLAEMTTDPSGEVPYHDFVRRWVSMMFELRQHPLLSKYLLPSAMDTLGIPEPDRIATESAMPLLSPDMVKPSTPVLKPLSTEDDPTVPRRQGSKLGPRRRSTLSQVESVDGSRAESKKKEVLPPPGRGFMRRRSRMDQENLAKEQAAFDDKSTKLAAAASAASGVR